MSKTTTERERKTLTVRVASPDDAYDRLRERFDALDGGERPAPLYEVVLRSEEDLQRLLSPKNVELLRTVARESPSSIREAARLVERDVRQVHTNLEQLADLNLLEFEEEGRSKRPVVWYDDIDVELPIAEGSTAPA